MDNCRQRGQLSVGVKQILFTREYKDREKQKILASNHIGHDARAVYCEQGYPQYVQILSTGTSRGRQICGRLLNPGGAHKPKGMISLAEGYLVVTLMVRGLISSCLGIVSVSTPLSKVASALSACTGILRRRLR